MRKKLIHRLLLADLLFVILPLFIGSVIQIFMKKGVISQHYFISSRLFVLIVISTLLSLASFYKVKIILKPIRQLMNSIGNYRRFQKLLPIKKPNYHEAAVLVDALQDFYILIVDKDRELHRSHKLQQLGIMSSKVAHEIRNPLTTIRGSFELLQMKPGNTELREKYAPLILSEIDRLNEIVEQMLEYSRTPVVNFEQLHLNKIIEDVIALNENSKSKEVLHYSFDLATDDIVFSDSHKLKQVLINVLRNAAEAVGDKGSLTIRSKVQDESLVLQIIDDGIGIPEDVLVKIGTPFFTTKSNGTGLGIANCIKLMEELSGWFELTSKFNVGTTAHIKIPKINPKQLEWTLRN